MADIHTLLIKKRRKAIEGTLKLAWAQCEPPEFSRTRWPWPMCEEGDQNWGLVDTLVEEGVPQILLLFHIPPTHHFLPQFLKVEFCLGFTNIFNTRELFSCCL